MKKDVSGNEVSNSNNRDGDICGKVLKTFDDSWKKIPKERELNNFPIWRRIWFYWRGAWLFA